MTESRAAMTARTRFRLIERLRSFVFAWRGLRWLIHNEHNARVHLAASIAVVGAGLFLRVSVQDWRWLFLAMGMVWAAEAFNTALEQLCDRVEPGFDPVIGRIKDVSAAAVLLLSMTAAAVGFLALGPPLLAFLTSVTP